MNKSLIYSSPLSQWDQIKLDTKGRSGIYCWTNKLNNKQYVGQAKDLWSRLIDYGQPWYLRKSNLTISRALKKYGMENFTLTILEFIDSPESTLGKDLDLAENNAIKLLKPKYNILQEARSSRGYKHTEVTKRLISQLKKGWTHSAETKAKMSESRKGINNNMFGKETLDSTKAKMRVAALNRIKSSKPGTLVEVTDIKTNIMTTYPSIRQAAIGINHPYWSLKAFQKNSSTIYKDQYLINFISS